MKNNIKRVFFLTYLTAIILPVYQVAKAQVIQEVQNSFNLYKQSSLQEKVFVNTDKTVYLPGEILWFKVYCVDGNDHKPLNLSKVVYLEILDNSQNPIIQTKVEMKNGLGDGSVYIPVSANNGSYKLRAYTNWMKNFSPEFYFEKPLTIINTIKIPEPIKPVVAKNDIQFFPEGGNLIMNVVNKVAFKAVDIHGNGVSIRGVIMNSHNDTVTKFKSFKFGMGIFLFKPDSDKKYKAIIYTDNNVPIEKDLPEIVSKGYGLLLAEADNGKLNFTISAVNIPDENIFLFAHTRQAVVAAETGFLKNGKVIFTLDKSTLGDGITHFTIFNSLKQPVCERLYFKTPAHNFLIDASSDQPQYNKRKPVNISIALKNANVKPLNTSLSMSVYRIDSLQEIDPMNIFNYLWLNSELKGKIESADYYLKNDDAETREAQNNLMLTQGWSRFKWEPLLQNNSSLFTYLPEYNGHIITGKVYNSGNNTPARNIITYLGIPGKRVQLYTSQSDTLGRLQFIAKDFYGPNEIIAQTNTAVDSTYRLELNNPFSDQYSKSILSKFWLDASQLKSLKEHSLDVQVLNLYNGDKIRKFEEPNIDSTAFYGNPYKKYKLDDYTRFTTMEEDLREYVSEDNITKVKGKFHIKVLNENGFLDTDPLALIDGIPFFNIDKIFNIDPFKVKKLEVVPFRYYYGPTVNDGIFSFTTYKGDLGGVDLDPKAVVMDYEGLQLKRQFYSPVYGSENQSTSRIPDFRNLLYWSADVKGPVTFYTSDQKGKYVGVVQGLTSKGDAGLQYFYFEVN